MERGLRQTLAPAGVHVVQTPSARRTATRTRSDSTTARCNPLSPTTRRTASVLLPGGLTARPSFSDSTGSTQATRVGWWDSSVPNVNPLKLMAGGIDAHGERVLRSDRAYAKCHIPTEPTVRDHIEEI